jgi:hypothetical protein
MPLIACLVGQTSVSFSHLAGAESPQGGPPTTYKKLKGNC